MEVSLSMGGSTSLPINKLMELAKHCPKAKDAKLCICRCHKLVENIMKKEEQKIKNKNKLVKKTDWYLKFKDLKFSKEFNKIAYFKSNEK